MNTKKGSSNNKSLKELIKKLGDILEREGYTDNFLELLKEWIIKNKDKNKSS